MSPETQKTVHHLLTQIARLLGIDNGYVRADFKAGQPKKVSPTQVIRLAQK